MKGLCVAVVLLLAVAVPQAVSYIVLEQIAVAGTAIGFSTQTITPTGLPQATQAVCRARTAEMSYRLDGGTPTASVGTLLEIGDVLIINGHDSLVRFLAIRTGGSSGQLDCTASAP